MTRATLLGVVRVSGLPTPYMNEDGDWWVAADEVASVEEARAVLEGLGVDLAFDFVGMTEATLREGEWDDESAPSRRTLSYHFEDREDFGAEE